jgi:choline dehydrogenase
MGPGADDVVDHRLKVHGIAHLRIADASVMPSVTSGNTNIPVMAIAERAADMLRDRHA